MARKVKAREEGVRSSLFYKMTVQARKIVLIELAKNYFYFLI